MRLTWDCETRWQPDLREVGAFRCCVDQSAGVNCIAWAVDDGPVGIVPYDQCYKGSSMNGFAAAFKEADVIVAHNAQFEQLVAELILGLRTKARWIDTMAKAAYYGYPRSLKDAARALGCTGGKDMGGHQVMKKLVTGKWTPDTAPDWFARLYSYCAQDVRVTQEVDRLLPDLPEQVQREWELVAEINRRGMPVDVRAIRNGLAVAAVLDEKNQELIAELTGGQVTSVNQTAKIREYLKEFGLELPDLSADTVARSLQQPMHPTARLILELRRGAGLSSLAKYKSMASYEVNGRLHGMLDWYGASTGRNTSTGPQVHNFARSAEPEFWADLLSICPSYYYLTSNPGERLKEALRGIICAPDGKVFVGMDLAQIEARATGWLADCKQFLALFATSDPYCTYGKKIFGREITKKNDPVERTASKANLLALGFAGGIGAYQRVAENYKIDFAVMAALVLPTATAWELENAKRSCGYYYDKEPEKPLPEDQATACDILKQRYRAEFPEIVAYWDMLEQAFLLGGQAGRIHVDIRGGGLRVLTLPSGRQLFYHGVVVEEVEKKDKHGFMVKSVEYSYQSRLGRQHLWKGTLIENCAQAINADISNWYKLRANEQVGPVVHECHDELTLEVESCLEGITLEGLKALTTEKPHWCDGLPLGFDFWTGRRYGK